MKHDICSNFTEQLIRDMSSLLAQYFESNQSKKTTASQPCALILMTKLAQTSCMLNGKSSELLDAAKTCMLDHFSMWEHPEWPMLGKKFAEEGVKEWAVEFLSCIGGQLGQLFPDLLGHRHARLIFSSSYLAAALAAGGKTEKTFLPASLSSFVNEVVALMDSQQEGELPFLAKVCGVFGWPMLFESDNTKHLPLEGEKDLSGLGDFAKLVWQGSPQKPRPIKRNSELGKKLASKCAWSTYLQGPYFWEMRMQTLLTFSCQSTWLVDSDLLDLLLRDKVCVRHPDNLKMYSWSSWAYAATDEVELFFSWLKNFVRQDALLQPLEIFLENMCKDPRNWKPHDIPAALMKAVHPRYMWKVMDVLSFFKQSSAIGISNRRRGLNCQQTEVAVDGCLRSICT